MEFQVPAINILLALPVLIVAVTGLLLMILDLFVADDTLKRWAPWISGAGLIVALVQTLGLWGYNGGTFTPVGEAPMLVVDNYATFLNVLFLVTGLLTLLISVNYLQRTKLDRPEYYMLMLFSLSGMMLMGMANDLILIFLALELLSIPLYIMAGFAWPREDSEESAMKYFLLGAFATGFLVYGIALIYGSVGSMSYTDMYTVAMESEITLKNLYWVGIGMLLVGLSFKVAAFPFHVWVPDVYTGAPTVVTAFMSTAGKAAAFSVLIPVVAVVLPEIETMERIQMLIAVIAAMSMLYGNIGAISQTNVKRMLAYSSVAHAGYLLMGVAVGTDAGQQAVMYYLTAYMFMQVGAFVVAAIVESKPGEDCTLEDYKGLSKRNPGLAACMAVFMLSLTGIPFLVGFFGKYYIFKAAIEADMIWLTIVGVVASVISVYFYLGLIVKMYFQDREDEVPAALPGGIANLTLIVTVVGVLVLGFFLDYSVLPTITF